MRVAGNSGNGAVRCCLERAHRVVAVAAFVAMERALVASGLTVLPPPLVGMAALFAALLAAERLGGAACAGQAFRALEPGYRFLLKWAPVFFIPALVRLPLVEAHFSPGELLRIGLLLGLGSALQLALVATLAAAFPAVPGEPSGKGSAATAAAAGSPLAPSAPAPYPRPGRPYKRRWLPAYAAVMAAAAVAARCGWVPGTAEAAFTLCGALLAFVASTSLPAGLRNFLHPIFVGVAGSWVAVALWAAQAGPDTGFYDVLLRYSSKSGAGPYLSMMLGPLVIALALLLYERRDLLQRDLLAVLGSAALAALAGLFGTVLLGRLLGVPPIVAAASVTRFCTAALALPVAVSLGASQPLAVVMLVLSGFLGVLMGRPVLSLVGARTPRERGLALGAVSHVLGTVTLASWGEAPAVPYSALAFVLASGFTALFAALPPVHDALLWLVA